MKPFAKPELGDRRDRAGPEEGGLDLVDGGRQDGEAREDAVAMARPAMLARLRLPAAKKTPAKKAAKKTAAKKAAKKGAAKTAKTAKKASKKTVAKKATKKAPARKAASAGGADDAPF